MPKNCNKLSNSERNKAATAEGNLDSRKLRRKLARVKCKKLPKPCKQCGAIVRSGPSASTVKIQMTQRSKPSLARETSAAQQVSCGKCNVRCMVAAWKKALLTKSREKIALKSTWKTDSIEAGTTDSASLPPKPTSPESK